MPPNKWRDAPNDKVLDIVSQTSSWLESPDFPDLFRRILALNLDTSLPLASRTSALSAVQAAFRSIEKPHIRKACAPIVSIAIWQHIQDKRRNKLFEESATLKKAWRASEKRYQAADPQAQVDSRIDSSWLFSVVADFLGHVNSTSAVSAEQTLYCQRFLEFLTDLASTLPTSRYTNVLFQDLSVLPIIRQSPKLRDQLGGLADLLHHFLTYSRTAEFHYAAVASLQRIALKHFPQSLKVLGLSNIGLIDLELDAHFTSLSDNDLTELCEHLDLRTTWPKASNIDPNRGLLVEIIKSQYQRPQDFRDAVDRLSILPTEN